MANVQINNKIYISSGATLSDADIMRNGGQVYVSSGGTGVRLSAFGIGFGNVSEGSIIVGGGGLVTDSFISGGYMSVAGDQATARNTTITGRGWQDVGLNYAGASGNGLVIDTHIESGSYQFVYGTGVASNSYVSSGAFQNLQAAGAKAYNTEVFAGGLMTVLSGTSAFNPNIHSGGTGYVSAGGTVFASNGNAAGVTINNGSGVALSGGVLSEITALNGTRVTISSGGTIANSVMSANAWTVVSGGGSADTVKISENAKLIMSGGSATNISVYGSGFIPAGNSAAGRLEVASGADVSGARVDGGYIAVRGNSTDVTLTSAGWMDVGLNVFNSAFSTGADTATATHIENQSKQFVYGTGTARETYISSGGTQDLLTSGAKAFDSTILSGGAVLLKSGTLLSGGTVASGGLLSATSGGSYAGTIIVSGIASGGTILTAGLVDIVSGGTFAGPVRVGSGGSLQIDSSGKLTGAARLDAGASATVNIQAGGTVVLPSGQDYTALTLTGSEKSSVVISGFKGSDPKLSDHILLKDIPRSNIIGVDYPDADTVRFRMRDGTALDLNIIGVQKYGYDLSDNGSGSTVFSVCFLSGTMISTPSGEIAVETLKIGDYITAYEGDKEKTRKIIWTGMRSVSSEETENAELTSFPIRIKAEAFGVSEPREDLLITPEHCVLIDGALIPARMLVNGVSIFHDTTLREYTYHHFETEAHSIVRSNGILSESYLDTGNRRIFSDRRISFLPPVQNAAGLKKQAAPLNVTHAFVEPIWSAIAKRAGITPRKATASATDPDFYIETDQEEIIRPIRVCGERWIFQIPASANLLYLCSRSGRPSDVIGPYVDDRRKLGLLIGDITIFSSGKIETVNVATFMNEAEGWLKPDNAFSRWTSGRAVLPLFTTDTPDVLRMLSIHVLASGPYAIDHAEPCQLFPEERISIRA